MRKFLTAFLILCAISPLFSACGLVDAIISLGYTPTPTITLTPTVTMTPSSTPTATASATPTETLTPTATPTDTATPTETPTSTPTPTETPTPTPTSTDTPVPSPTWDAETLVGAGDIAICGLDTDDKTADLLARIPGQIFIAGDVSNEQGTYEQFANCFSQSWGRFLERIHPVPGNHDYQTLGASGYYDYFGAIAGDRYKGYYSYNVGAWHIVALNSMCSNVGGCTADAPQAQWLKQDLADNPAKCTLAYMHHPRFSSGQAGNINWVDAYYRILYDAGADVLIGGHEHDYERFAPQDPLGNLDVERGIRQFVVGTGGAYSIGFYDIKANSEVRNTGDFGVIKFSLFADKYAWEFISAEGSDFSDFGVDSCH